MAFVFALLVTNKDFGPMADAVAATETASRNAAIESEGGESGESESGPLDPKPGTPYRALNALIPFGTIVASTFVGMILDGRRSLLASGKAVTFVSALSNSDSVKVNHANSPTGVSLSFKVAAGALPNLSPGTTYQALLWSSALGWIVTMGLLLSQRILNLEEAMGAFTEGMKEVIIIPPGAGCDSCKMLRAARSTSSESSRSANFVCPTGCRALHCPLFGLGTGRHHQSHGNCRLHCAGAHGRRLANVGSCPTNVAARICHFLRDGVIVRNYGG